MLKLVLLMGLLGLNGYAAETFVAKQISSANRLVPLQKITVGPDDQYRGSVDPQGETLVFTKKSDLVPHLCRQDVHSGEVSDLLSLSADSQEATISPEGMIAFTYYKFSAHGDICYKPLPKRAGESGKSLDDEKFPCLKGPEGERSSPFWKGPKELGYVLRNTRTQTSQILVQNIETGATETLVEGRVWSPAMKPGGKYLFYNEMLVQGVDANRALVMRDLTTRQTRVLHFALPGISGFPAVSDDEKYLYFSHYLNDTNHDNVIDGNDNSVVFRSEIDRLSADSIFPEQLTSAENNCSLPSPYQNDLYVTCAFEGNLDIYRIPVTGVVPTAWNEPMLLNAHETSRTYQERILILNTVMFRGMGPNNKDLIEKLLANHLLSEDTSAGKYYVGSLQTMVSPDKKSFYGLVRIYLDALELKNLQPSEEQISPTFQKQILALDAELEKAGRNKNPRLTKIFHGLLRSFLNQPAKSLEYLKQVKFDAPAQPLERHYYFELADRVLPKSEISETRVSVYRNMMTAPELSEESHLYYAFNFLKQVHDSDLSQKDRLGFLIEFNHGLPKAVDDLIKSETTTLRLIEAPTDAEKTKIYGELDALMGSSRSDYFLRKALYVRAILNFAEAGDTTHLTYIASNWLRYTNHPDTEFAYAREVVVNASLDRGYDTLAAKKYQLASGYFFGSLIMTDDLESHYGYIRSMLLFNQRNKIDAAYQDLQKRNLIDDNMKYVRALLRIVDANPSSRGVGHLDDAIEQLKSMQQDRDSAIRYLLLGYCYLDKLMRTSDGYDFDRSLFEGAHRSLMLAYDIGRDNDRVEAAALMNLGILHQRVQNHGLAVKFFSKRKPLGFVSGDEAARFAWYFSRSLFYNFQADRAAQELVELTPDQIPAEYVIPIRERSAFYLQNAGDFEKSAQLYEKLLRENSLKGDLNLAKVNLGYGFCLFKLKRDAEARKILRVALDHTSRLSVIPKGGDRPIDFDPLRLKLDAYGWLGRIGSNGERVDALEKRNVLLEEAKSKALYDDVALLIIQNHLQLAQLYTANDAPKAKEQMKLALQLAEALGDSGQYLSRAVYQTIVDYLAHGVLYPELYRSEDSARIKRIVDKTIQAYEAQKQAAPILAYQKSKIKILWAGFSTKALKSGGSDLAKLIDPSAVRYQELVSLAEAVGR